MRLHCCHLPVTSPEAERPSEHTKSTGGICCWWTGAGILASDSGEMSYGGISAFRVSHGIGLCLRDASQVPEIPEGGNLGFGLNLCLCLRASFLSVKCNHRKGRDGFFSMLPQSCSYTASLPQNTLHLYCSHSLQVSRIIRSTKQLSDSNCNYASTAVIVHRRAVCLHPEQQRILRNCARPEKAMHPYALS